MKDPVAWSQSFLVSSTTGNFSWYQLSPQFHNFTKARSVRNVLPRRVRKVEECAISPIVVSCSNQKKTSRADSHADLSMASRGPVLLSFGLTPTNI
jgi:hypothetical protein